jgi:hypothetical protein
MSKSGKTKYRWYDEEDDFSRDKRNKNKHRNEKKLKNALRSKNFDELSNQEKHIVGDWDLD